MLDLISKLNHLRRIIAIFARFMMLMHIYGLVVGMRFNVITQRTVINSDLVNLYK